MLEYNQSIHQESTALYEEDGSEQTETAKKEKNLESLRGTPHNYRRKGGEMGQKEQLYASVAQQVSRQITEDFHDWTEFLRMAGRLYKYPFDQQLLVYAQRPEAVACASELSY